MDFGWDYDISMQVHQLQQMHHLGGRFDNRKNYVCMGEGHIQEISVPFQFCCEPKIALKN